MKARRFTIEIVERPLPHGVLVTLTRSHNALPMFSTVRLTIAEALAAAQTAIEQDHQ